MKIPNQNIKISLDQLFKLFRHDQESLQRLLNDADCPICNSVNALVNYEIILTAESGVRLEGKCRFCNESLVKYSSHKPNKLFRVKALTARIESQDIEVLAFLRERFQEGQERQLEKDSFKLTAKENTVYYQIKVTLINTQPQIWRRILILPTTSLKTLHKILQIAMGWTDSHLHQFIHEGCFYGDSWDHDHEMVYDYDRMKIQDFLLYPNESCIYEYDLGDGWKHLIQLEEVISEPKRLPAPACLEGAGKCPPEDCGGPGGFAEIKKIIKKPKHPEYGDTLRWLGGSFNPDEFDFAAINRELLKRAKFRYPPV